MPLIDCSVFIEVVEGQNTRLCYDGNTEARITGMQEVIPTSVDLRKYIDTKYYGERPHVRGRRVLVSMIAANAETNHWSVPQLAYEFSLSEEQVLAALLYYREHKAEIDQQDAEEQKQFDEIYRHQARPE